MLGVVWCTVLLVGVLMAFVIILWYVRSIYKDSSAHDYNVDMNKLTRYIRRAKEQESQAWNQALSVMADEREELTDFHTVCAPTKFESKAGYFNPTAIGDHYSHTKIIRFADTRSTAFGDSKIYEAQAQDKKIRVRKPQIPPTFMQLAFFKFWRISLQHPLSTAAQANQIIESYKNKLKRDGFAHRVHRWNRLELMMGRFCSDYDIAQLNKVCTLEGIQKSVLDLLLEVCIQLLSKKEVRWKDLTSPESYRTIIVRFTSLYPHLELERYHR